MRTSFIVLGLSILLSGCLPQSTLVFEQSQPINPSTTPVPVIGKPTQLLIPEIEVSATVEWVGLTAEKRMDVPKDWWNVGWYNLGVKPGEQGNAVIAGHLDSPTGPAVFIDLKRLAVGNVISIIDEWGIQRDFVVIAINTYKDEQFPLEAVFGAHMDKRLQLITCEGVFDSKTSNYSDRLVITAELKD